MGKCFYGKGNMENIKSGISEIINSRNYWEDRFETGDWENKGGRRQTASFASAQVRRFLLPKEFAGLLVDFGCGLGDAMPIYNAFFPNANLLGLDVSEKAIEKCQARYGQIANFIHGTHLDVPVADVIIASNVFEHLSDDINIAKELLNKCRDLYIIVPYKEDPLCSEHVRAYDENYFRDLGEYEFSIFPSRGWSEYGLSLFKLQIKNLFRWGCGIGIQPRRSQIMFHFRRTLW